MGCPAVFLLGGETKMERPTAMLVRDGDVVVLSGQARRCYHGVPRVLAHHQHQSERRGRVRRRGEEEEAAAMWEEDEEVGEYLRTHRINVSVRMVRGPSEEREKADVKA